MHQLCQDVIISSLCASGRIRLSMILVFVTSFFLWGKVVSSAPNPQPGGAGDLVSTRPPVQHGFPYQECNTLADIALRVIETRKLALPPYPHAKMVILFRAACHAVYKCSILIETRVAIRTNGNAHWNHFTLSQGSRIIKIHLNYLNNLKNDHLRRR